MSGTSSPQPTLAVRGFNSGLAWTPLRKHAGERGEEGTIGRPQRGALFLPSEHGQLMSQHEQLDVFGDLAAPASDKQPQHSREPLRSFAALSPHTPTRGRKISA